MALKIHRFDKGAVDENTYIVVDDIADICFVVDPGRYDDKIKSIIDDTAGLEYIILTHGHGDHIKELPSFRKEYTDAELVADFDEKRMLNDFAINASRNICGKDVEDDADVYVTDGDTLGFGDRKIKFIHTPGHTPGGMCISIDGILFTGDTLLKNDVGRSDFPGGSWEDLKHSIKDKLFLLPDDTIVYPGHGLDTSIGHEKKMNPYV